MTASRAPAHCRFCKEPLHAGAAVCRYCQRTQKWWPLFTSEWIALVATATAIATVVLGSLQYQASRSERSEADKALRDSQSALALAHSISDKNERLLRAQLKLRSQVVASFGSLFTDICRGVDGTYEPGTRSCVLKNGYSINYQVTEP